MTTAAPRFWFLDTSSLIIDIVHDELAHLASVASTATLAKAAQAHVLPGWKTLDTEQHVPVEEVQQAQADVADGRALTDDDQHWAESTIIALARRSSGSGVSVKLLLSEDYDARRVADLVPNTHALSVHAPLHSRVHAGRMTAESAATLAAKRKSAKRGPQVSAEDFDDPTGRALGRVAHPR